LSYTAIPDVVAAKSGQPKLRAQTLSCFKLKAVSNYLTADNKKHLNNTQGLVIYVSIF